MRKLITAAAAAAAILVAGAIAGEAQAAPLGGAGILLPPTQSSAPVQKAACWCGPYRCACGWRRPYYRRYYGPYYRPYRYYYGPYRRWRY
jgi:uncharacterized low-complexity protein